MIAVLEQYMPAQLSADDVRSTVEQLIAEHGSEFRKVMPQAARTLRGRADLGQVNKLVRELTGG